MPYERRKKVLKSEKETKLWKSIDYNFMTEESDGGETRVKVSLLKNIRAFNFRTDGSVRNYRTLASLRPPLLKRNFALKRGGGVTTRTAYTSALLRPRSLRSSIPVVVLYHTYAAFRKGISEHI